MIGAHYRDSGSDGRCGEACDALPCDLLLLAPDDHHMDELIRMVSAGRRNPVIHRRWRDADSEIVRMFGDGAPSEEPQ